MLFPTNFPILIFSQRQGIFSGNFHQQLAKKNLLWLLSLGLMKLGQVLIRTNLHQIASFLLDTFC